MLTSSHTHRELTNIGYYIFKDLEFGILKPEEIKYLMRHRKRARRWIKKELGIIVK